VSKIKRSGNPPRGKSPVPPVEGAQNKDQINLTDKESRIMQVAGADLTNAVSPPDTTSPRSDSGWATLLLFD